MQYLNKKIPLNQENIESIARDENMREEPQILRKGLQMRSRQIPYSFAPPRTNSVQFWGIQESVVLHDVG